MQDKYLSDDETLTQMDPDRKAKLFSSASKLTDPLGSKYRQLVYNLFPQQNLGMYLANLVRLQQKNSKLVVKNELDQFLLSSTVFFSDGKLFQAGIESPSKFCVDIHGKKFNAGLRVGLCVCSSVF